ncbi:VanZ family protein [Microbacterium sp. NPDC019599]|uniref:VanZ family protein n=1 Tax=Microbacterium sp. NPDC019599 TaxID=3154690 RepID=UPI0033CCCBBC
MKQQVLLAVLAVSLGVAVAFLVFVPYVAIAHRRHGRLGAARILVPFAMLVYGMSIWIYTLAPFPEPGAIDCAGLQLDPLQFVRDLRGASAPGHALADPAVMQLFLNVVLFLPLGVFVRVMWNRGVVVSLVAGLALSLLIELTQLTGVWGIYPCAYRVFDVDDLLTNTIGAVLGSLLSLALPRAWRVGRADPADARAPQPVTKWRRALGMVCDWVSVYLLGLTIALPVSAIVYVTGGREALVASNGLLDACSTLGALAVTGSVAIATGRTIGDHAMQLAYRGTTLPPFWAGVVRFFAGIGGYQVLTAPTEGANPVSMVFVLASIVLALATAKGRGLPGIASRQVPTDVREAREPSSASR